jgi:serine/threonine-protein kinase
VIGSATTVAGRYRLEAVIGRGGMSTVYRATDLALGRTVAVKVLLPALVDRDPTFARRFQREARAAAALTSSAVVTVYDTGVDDDGQYIVMEYVEGRSLADLLRDEEPLELSEALRIGERVASALAAAHAAGIFHRDIKPANVMVGSEGSVKLLDFGIARKLDGTTLTQVASVIGTAAYMAPERAAGEPGDARADIYSLGCLIFAMLTGRPPFGGEVAAAVLHQQLSVEPRPPSRLRTGIPPELDALVLAMLAKSPDARPRSAGEVGAALAGLGLAARAPSVTAPAAALGQAAATTRRTATGATARLPGIAATAPVSSRGRGTFVDHRRRAIVMALVTAAITLLAVALLSSGSSPHHPATAHHAATHAPRRVTAPTTTQHTRVLASPQPPQPEPPKTRRGRHDAGGPPGHGGEPPGQGGEPPGQAKKGGD